MGEFEQHPSDRVEGDQKSSSEVRSDSSAENPKTNEARPSDLSPQLTLWPSEEVAPEPADALPSLSNLEALRLASLDPPWSLADLGAFILFAFFSFVAANLAGAALLSVLRNGLGWRVSVQQALTETPWVVAMQTGWELLWLAFIYVTVSKKYHRRFWDALKWVRARRSSIAYLVAGAAVALAAQLLMNLFPSQKHLPIEKLFANTESAYLLAFFGICVAPFVEELVFRGFFYPVFERLWGLAAAVVLTGFLFAAIHVPQLSGGWEEIASIFFVGMAFSYCRGKTGSLIPPFLMHLAYNLSLFASLYISTDRFRSLKG